MSALNNQIILVFSLDEKRYALPLDVITRVIRVVAVTEVPGLPSHLEGIVNVHGTLVPVVNIRQKLLHPLKEKAVEDRMILIDSPISPFIISVDHSIEVVNITEFSVEPSIEEQTDQSHFSGVVQLQDGLVLLCKADSFFSRQDLMLLRGALKRVNI